MRRVLVACGIASLLANGQAGAGDLGRFICHVQQIHGTDELGKLWKDTKLAYDANAGTLDVLKADSTPLRLFSRLKVETRPSPRNNLVAVQYDPASPPEVPRPIVAWLTLETLQGARNPAFKFFSNTIRVIASGRCTRRD